MIDQQQEMSSIVLQWHNTIVYKDEYAGTVGGNSLLEAI